MADITEVIHKITYEVNDDQLKRASVAINAQLNELVKLNKELQNLQVQIERSSYKQTESVKKLASEFERLTKKIEQSAGKTKGVLEQIGDGVLQAFGSGSGISGIVSNFLTPLTQGLTKVETAGTLSFANLAKTVFSFGNVVTASISIIGLLATAFFESGEKAEDMSEKIDKAAEFAKKLGEESSGDISELLKLKTTIENTTLSFDKRTEAIRKLKDQYPQYFDNLRNEELLVGKIGDAYQKAFVGIVAVAKGRVLTRELENALSDLRVIKGKVEEKAKEDNVALDITSDPTTGLEKIQTKNVNPYQLRKYAPKEVLQRADEFGKPNPRQRETPKAFSDISAELNNVIEEYNAIHNSIHAILSDIQLNEKNIPEPRVSDDTPIKGNYRTGMDPKINKRIPGKSLNYKIQIPEPSEDDLPKELRPQPLALLQQPESAESKALREDVVKARNEEEEELAKRKQQELELQEKRRAEIKKTISDYQSLAKSAVDAFQTIYDAQIKALDAEIEIRKQRVEAATKLAERGNADALRIEQERMNEVMKKREEYARRQQILNSALAVSNAVLAVAQAAGETGPLAIAVVPAVIAAIIAGYAAISAATRESTAQAFADGVVNFRGKGGPRDDANRVWISSGESVITAEGTKKNKALLEAINKGAGFKLVDTFIPNMLPTLRQPAFSDINHSYASKQEMKSLEGKLDEVVYAIEDNKLRQNIFFNEQGVGIMTEKAVNRNRKRWS